jgi:hypothetical protein
MSCSQIRRHLGRNNLTFPEKTISRALCVVSGVAAAGASTPTGRAIVTLKDRVTFVMDHYGTSLPYQAL